MVEPEPVIEPRARGRLALDDRSKRREPEQQPAVEPVLETTGEQPELTPMPAPTPDSVVRMPLSGYRHGSQRSPKVDAATPGH